MNSPPMYHLSWSRFRELTEETVRDAPDAGGIYRLWSVLGQSLMVGRTDNLRQSLEQWLYSLAAHGDAGHDRIFVDWSKATDRAKRNTIHSLEVKRLRPIWNRRGLA